MKNNVGRAIYSVNTAYANGNTAYPRVANDYVLTLSFYEHPHPPLKQFDDFSKPMLLDKYPLTKETILLELTNVKISTPATLFNNFKYIDKFYDDELNPKKDMKEVIEKKVNEFYIYLDNFASIHGKSSILNSDGDIDINTIAKDGIVSMPFMQKEMQMFDISLSPEPSKKEERGKGFKESKYMRVSDKVENIDEESFQVKIRVSSLAEALKIFKLKRLLLNIANEERLILHEILAKENETNILSERVKEAEVIKKEPIDNNESGIRP